MARRGKRLAKGRRSGVETREPAVRWHRSDALPGAGRRAPRNDSASGAPVVTPRPQPPPPPPPLPGSRSARHHPSPRRSAQLEHRKTTRRRLAGKGTIGLTAVAVVAAAVFVVTKSATPDEKRATRPLSGPATTQTTLFIGSGDEGGALWLGLASHDTIAHTATFIYIPAHTAVEVPGRGLQGVGSALQSGGPGLVSQTLETLLNVEIDNYVEMTEQGARVLLAEMGPLSVDIPAEVRVPAGAGTTRLLFPAGLQELSTTQLVDLLYLRGLESDDVELGARHLAFWDAVFDEFRDDSLGLRAAVAATGDILGRSDGSPVENAKLLGSIASLPPEDMTLSILPVRQVSVGGAELYATEDEEIASFIDSTLSGAATPTGGLLDIQVLNGNGVPGIGSEVASALEGGPYRVVLSANADRFDYRKTMIVTYDATPEGIDAAERIRSLMGVGRVLVSAQEQGRVNLTIVVGKDFLRRD
jgi:hypothetical protein